MTSPTDYIAGDAELERRFRELNPTRRPLGAAQRDADLSRLAAAKSLKLSEVRLAATVAALGGADGPAIAPDAVALLPTGRKGASKPAVHPLFAAMLREAGLPLPEPEYLFAASLGRKFRADYCWPGKVILELEGGVRGKGWGTNCPTCKRPKAGGHSSVTGILRDISKMNTAARLGYLYLRCEPDALLRTETMDLIREALTRQEHIQCGP